MPVFIDQLNREVEISVPPTRVVSLVPSQTELLYDLGLREEVIGITKFCIHPKEWFRSKTRVGGTKKLDIKKIIALSPDLIIANKEENDQQQIEELMRLFPVWMSDVYTLNDTYDMISRIGNFFNREGEAQTIVAKIKAQYNELKDFLKVNHPKKLKVAYFIWKNPYMVAASGTFIDHLLHCAGFINIFSGEKYNRYPEITAEQLQAANPDVIFLSSEPYPFSEKNIAVFQQICSNAKIEIVDGELFSWYGSRIQYTFKYMKDLIVQLSLKRENDFLNIK